MIHENARFNLAILSHKNFFSKIKTNKLKQTKPFQTNGVDNLKWIGVDGIQRTLIGGACNTHIPTLANLTNIITEKNSLPIVKVLYGPMVHESQSGKVIIGPLICEPKPLDDWSQVDLETHVKTLAQKMDNDEITFENELNTLKAIINDTESSLTGEIEILKKFQKFHGKPNCPANDQLFRTILGDCYYFENMKRNFTDALTKCRNKFGYDTGKLFEPADITIFKKVQTGAKTFFGVSDVWTGFIKIDNNGNLKRSSNGAKLTGKKICEGQENASCSLTAVEESSVVFNTNHFTWNDRNPDSVYKSICVSI